MRLRTKYLLDKIIENDISVFDSQYLDTVECSHGYSFHPKNLPHDPEIFSSAKLKSMNKDGISEKEKKMH